jgi:eukaryotic-like serine/threonine-protein kinase
MPGTRPVKLAAIARRFRFLEKRPILARPTASWERIAKWTRRRPALAGLWAVSALALLGLAAVMFAYNGRLRRERVIADGQRDIARKAQARSEADFRLALDAVKRFYTDVSENRLVSAPAARSLRVELLERARVFYEQIARDRPDDPDVQAELGRAGWRLAVMAADARSVPEAIDLMAAPIAIQERIPYTLTTWRSHCEA